jgi:hypothetical protein
MARAKLEFGITAKTTSQAKMKGKNMKNQKLSYRLCLSIFVLIGLTANSVFLLQRIVSQDSIGKLLLCVNEILAMIFLLIYLNFNYKLGTILYFLSFMCYLFINIFLLSNSDILTVSTFFRLIVIICLFFPWLKSILLGRV